MIKTNAYTSRIFKYVLGISVATGASIGAHAVGIDDVVDGGNNFA